MSAEFVTTIWRDNDATNIATSSNNIGTSGNNIGTSGNNIGTSNNNTATDHLAENKRIVDEIVSAKVKPWMRKIQIQDCIIEACIVDHSIDL